MSGERQDGRRIVDNVTERLIRGGYRPDEAVKKAIETRKRIERDNG